jgi:LPXTG-motif cell wall-anchored protein
MKWLVLLIILSTSVCAATIQGNVYDFSLEPVINAIVEIDTSPHQILVAKDGSYSFNVPAGKYTISAESQEQYMEENITVVAEGNYILDLILLPSLDYEDAMLDSLEDSEFSEIEIEDEPKDNTIVIIIGIIVLAVIIALLFKRRKKPAAEMDPPLKKILQFIEKQGGRTTQKDIYKELPWSESKISLMLDELESQALIRKVKKGRSNLIFRK